MTQSQRILREITSAREEKQQHTFGWEAIKIIDICSPANLSRRFVYFLQETSLQRF